MSMKKVLMTGATAALLVTTTAGCVAENSQAKASQLPDEIAKIEKYSSDLQTHHMNGNMDEVKKDLNRMDSELESLEKTTKTSDSMNGSVKESVTYYANEYEHIVNDYDLDEKGRNIDAIGSIDVAHDHLADIVTAAELSGERMDKVEQMQQDLRDRNNGSKWEVENENG